MYHLFAFCIAVLTVNAQPPTPEPQDATRSHVAKIYAEVAQKNQEPPFLKQATPADREEFLKIINNTSLTEEEMEKKINEWIAKQPNNVKTQFEKCKEDWTKLVTAIKTTYETSNLSKAAKDALHEFDAIGNNKSLTVEQEFQKGVELYNSLTPDVKDELRKFVEEQLQKLSPMH